MAILSGVSVLVTSFTKLCLTIDWGSRVQEISSSKDKTESGRKSYTQKRRDIDGSGLLRQWKDTKSTT